MSLPKLFQVNDDSPAADMALLAMRIIVGLTLFDCSGAPKLFHLPALISSGTDPLGLGALAPASKIFAAFALGICTLLVVVGLTTRYAAFFTTISLAGTFFVIDHSLSTNLLDPGHNTHPEVTWLYMSAYFALLFTGPGRYSLDKIFSRASHEAGSLTALSDKTFSRE
jgi:putative oxidoreductase